MYMKRQKVVLEVSLITRLCLAAFTGRGDFRRLRAAPAGGVPVPPAGHAHRALLQVQVQQRRRRPAADLEAPSEAEQGASLRTRRPSFLFLTLSALSSVPRFIFFGLSLHRPRPPGDSSLCMRGGGHLGLLGLVKGPAR